MDEYQVHKISISQFVEGRWHESFKLELPISTQTLRDIATVFLQLGTERERELELLLKEKNEQSPTV